MVQLIPDEQLIGQAASCSREAFEALVMRYRPALRMAIARYADTPDDQEDLAQDVVAILLDDGKRALRDWQPMAGFRAYLTTIACNRCRRWLRLPDRQRVSYLPSLAEQDGEWGRVLTRAGVEASADPGEGALAAEVVGAVRRAMERLSDRDQLLLRLRYQESLPPRSIAQVLDMADGTVRKALFDALRRLERRLYEEAPYVFP